MTAKEQAEKLRYLFNMVAVTDEPLTAKEEINRYSNLCVNQILGLSGLPQYQIVFWREVLEELKNS